MKKIILVGLTGCIVVTILGLLGSYAPVNFGGTFLLPVALLISTLIAGTVLQYGLAIKDGVGVVVLGTVVAALTSYLIPLTHAGATVLFILFGVYWALIYAGIYWLLKIWRPRASVRAIVIVFVIICSILTFMIAKQLSLQQSRRDYIESMQ